jgi:hypothetical protein
MNKFMMILLNIDVIGAFILLGYKAVITIVTIMNKLNDKIAERNYERFYAMSNEEWEEYCEKHNMN